MLDNEFEKIWEPECNLTNSEIFRETKSENNAVLFFTISFKYNKRV